LAKKNSNPSFGVEIVIATLILMAIGSATRMNAGLACPDLCYGELVPTQQMNLQVFLEWFHRLDAALIGISAIALPVKAGGIAALCLAGSRGSQRLPKSNCLPGNLEDSPLPNSSGSTSSLTWERRCYFRHLC